MIKEALIPGELAEDQVLIRVPFIFLNQQVISRRNWIVFVVFDLLDDSIETFERLQVRRGNHLKFYLVQNRDLVFSDDHAVELVLLDLLVPRMRLDVVDFVPQLRVRLHNVLHHVFCLLVDVAGHKVLARQNLLVQLVRV